ncbi:MULTISPECIES: hypothetical protein [unclassified Kitasatospora]|uniref:hypothetical protein n=1 Tax=unclassified Kitasatospora TaxID=2633591 RepID=UPI00070F3479|nr:MULTISPECIES: hypothetical protein [unclassified Kitasatospora]KQV05416.1 hypothetical protein ASC99_11270 [Kitasatospora sp. Root107]KRB62222.1 hypothetical protein ASE03_06215 [Kitasatospora sp. Root187]
MPTTSERPHFAAWLADTARDPEIGFEVEELSAEARGWYASVFDSHGEVPPPYLVGFLLERRVSVATTALDLLRMAAERDLGYPLALEVWTEPQASDETWVGVHGDRVRALGVQEAMATVASAVQDLVAGAHRAVWPTCAVHRLGLHPVLADGRAVWHCRTRGHQLPMP